MNREKLKEKVIGVIQQQCESRGFVTMIDVLIEIGALRREDMERWHKGQVDYLERVCRMNLSQLSYVMQIVQTYAKAQGLKPSLTNYHSYGKKPHRPLRFSKYGKADVERKYATHYVDVQRMTAIKKKR